MLNLFKILSVFIFLNSGFLLGQQIIRGTVVERDSNTAMPFVYIINKSNGNGTMSDNDGRFTISSNPKDTIICSYFGFAKLYVPVKDLPKANNGEVKLVMQQLLINLNPVYITTFKIKPYERDYMNDIIDRSRIKTIDYITSPISALYMRYSKEGKQINKLAKIFEGLLIEEQVQRKLSKEILIRLTGDEKIDYFAFRKYCYYVNDDYIITHEGAELYSKVMDCYKRWKAERRGQ
jgi:hypothetical protein